MSILRYIRNRLILFIPLLLGVTIISFSIMQLLPGDPVELMFEHTAVDRAQIERLREQLGLNDPLYVQYGRFLFHALQGDLGFSIRNNRPVSITIMELLPSTMELTLAAMAIAIVVGVFFGTLAAAKQHSWLDDLSMLLALVGVSMPSFWMGLLLIFLFSLKLGWLPATGQGGLERLVMPAFVLGIYTAGFVARLTRSSMLEVLRQDYVVTARSKGVAEWRVLVRHALKNALIPVVTIVGLQFGHLLGGAIVIETVFARRGLGSLIIDAILSKDYPLVQGAIMFTAAMYVFANLVVDISYAYLDPRIRYE